MLAINEVIRKGSIINKINQYRGKRHFIIVFFALFFLAGTAFAFIFSQDFLINYSKIVGSGYNKLSNLDESVVLQGMGVESLGGTPMSGGDYDINVDVENAKPSKLEDNLNNAHCYPNPFKPNSGLGHRIITFSRLTDYTKLKIVNIAGELVYQIEAYTPSGELPWDVINNSGEKLASGVYIYLITNNNGNKKIGKFAVIR